MKRQRGFQTDRLRRLLRVAAPKPRAENGPGPHLEVRAPAPPTQPPTETPGDRLRAMLDRWTRLNAPLPEALIRRGLVSLRLDLETLGEAARRVDAGRRETRVHQSAHFAVDVVCWASGRFGPILERGDSARGLLVVEGTATEILFEESPCGLLAPSWSRPIPEGTVSVARPGEIRSIGNLQAPGDDLIGLVVTSPPAGSGRSRSLSETIFGGAFPGP